MNDTIIVLLLPLLLLVMITPAAVYATNESSYKQGFTAGVDDYTGCQKRPDDCSPPDNDAPLQVCVNNPVNEVTNSTACIDGYVQGWQHWCKSDAKDCVDFMLSGRFPGALIYGKNVYHGIDGNYIKVPGIKHILPRPLTAPVPDLSKGVCPPWHVSGSNIRNIPLS